MRKQIKDGRGEKARVANRTHHILYAAVVPVNRFLLLLKVRQFISLEN